MFSFNVRKLKKKLANELQSIAAVADSSKNEFYELSDLLLNQRIKPHGWRKIYKELRMHFNILNDYINEGYYNALNNYEPWIRKFVIAFGKKDTFRVTNNERELFEHKDNMYKKMDEINKYFIYKQNANDKLKKLPNNDPQKSVLQMQIKEFGNQYIVAKKQVEDLAGYIYVIVSHENLKEQEGFYRKLKEGQILPTKLEDLTLKVAFYQDNVSSYTNESVSTIDGLYKDFEDSMSDDSDDESMNEYNDESNRLKTEDKEDKNRIST